MHALDALELLAWLACKKLDVDLYDEEGFTTAELAVVTTLLVGAAIVVGGIIFAAAKTNAENIPVPQAPSSP